MTWQESLRQNVTKASELRDFLNLTPQEEAQIAKILAKYPMSIPFYYLSLIDPLDKDDPIRKMSIPSPEEFDMGGLADTSGENENTVFVGMQHKYTQTAIILSTSQCAMYCRSCFRKRLVGLSSEEIARQTEEMIAYIKQHKSIKNVLISGGDAFLNSNNVIEDYLKKLCPIKHLDFIRFGTRTPVVFPARITEDQELLQILEKYSHQKQIYITTQFNHPRELTQAAAKAVKLLSQIGVGTRNQIVLLKGVNDNPQVLSGLLSGLTKYGVIPYYIFQCRPVTGVKNQFQVPLADGYEIVEQAKNLQSGFGKNLKYVLSHETGKIEILGKDKHQHMLFKYHQAKNPADLGKIFSIDLAPNQCWLD